jgi:hypothetical protein
MANPYASIIELADRFDLRAVRQLSNDDNQPDGDMRRINRILDAAASELESSLYGIWPLPLMINIGGILSSVAVNGLSFQVAQVPTGMSVGSRIVLGPDASAAPATANPPEIVEIVSISGSAPTITVTITGSGQSSAGQSGGFSFPHNTLAPISTVPGKLSDVVAILAGDKLFGRRATRPEGLDKDIEAVRKWIDEVRDGIVSIPGIERGNLPAIYDACGNQVSWPGNNFPCSYTPYAWLQPGWWIGCGW